MSGGVVLDDRDLAILRLLARNARVSFAEIGRVLGLSDVAVLKRVRRLEQLGVIQGYRVVVDPKKLGYSLISITGVDVEPEHLFEVVEYLKELNCVKFLAVTSGDHSVMATIWARSSDELARIHGELARRPGVKRVCPAIVLYTVKEEVL
ncbi:MAG: transcriptional regulator [Thermoprotei archaeon]|nr:MAG: transcriptional regulator [Thermoprotei archaeon]